MTILVKCTAGFIGTHTAAKLPERGETLIGVDNLNSHYPVALKEARIAEIQQIGVEQLTIHRADIGDEAELASTLSATDFNRSSISRRRPAVRYSLDNPAAYVRSNVAGHLNVLEIAHSRDIKHLVFASSSSVCGQHGDALSRRRSGGPAHIALSRHEARQRGDERNLRPSFPRPADRSALFCLRAMGSPRHGAV